MVRILPLLMAAACGAVWAQDGLNARTAAAGLKLGTSLEIGWTDKALAPLVTTQYGFLSPTEALEWDGNEDWATWVANAEALGLPFRGPRLAGGQTPQRLSGLDAKALDREYVARLKTLKGLSKALPLSWDAASNLFLPTGEPAPSAFRTAWGADWAARALVLARSVDPLTPLFLAEDGTLGLNPRSDALYKLAADLKARGVPLDGVALGARQRLSWRATGSEVGENLRRFAALGLTIHVIDWDYGLDRDQSIPDRTAVQLQASAYLEVFSWLLAFPAVKAVSVAEPSDKFVRSAAPPGGTPFAAPSLFASAGLAKAVVPALLPLLRRHPDAAELTTQAARLDLPSANLPTWHVVPITDESLPGGEFRHRATFYRNQPEASRSATTDDFGLYWYLSWTHEGLVFRVERSDDVILPGNPGEALSVEVRGPHFAASRQLVVGSDVTDRWLAASWSQGGRFLRVVFAVPPESGWGQGTVFFVRFSGTDSDGGRDLGLTLDPWPLSDAGTLPWKAFRLVTPY